MSDNSQPDAPQLPPNIRVLKNGAHYDLEQGHIVKAPTTSLIGHSQTLSSARLLELKRAKAQAGVIDAILAGTKQQKIRAGVAKLAAAQVTLALDPARGRTSTVAFRALLHHAGLAPVQQPDSPQTGATVTISSDVLVRMAELFASELAKRDK